MPRRPMYYRLKSHQIYTVGEAADTVGVHRKTVVRWIHCSDLPADTSRKPWLICGVELKVWLIKRREATRSKLSPGELYCLPCRAPKRPALNAADYRPRTARSGMLVGLCPDCERLIHRMVRRADLDRIAAGLEVTIP